MAVTGLEPTKTPGTVWANSWFVLGFSFVMLGLVITGVGVVLHFRREVRPGSAPPAVDAARGLSAVTPPAVNPDEFKPYHQESGEFPGSKALTFGFDHINDHPSAYMVLNPRRCTVVTPSGATVDATRTNRYFQYPQEFDNAPPVRPGIYRFKLEGQLTSGEWVFITSGEHEVKPPLITEIADSKFESWKRVALIAALRVKITNTTGTTMRLSSIGFIYDWKGLPGLGTTLSNDERLELDRELYARREGQRYGIPLNKHATVPANEFITGWVVEAAQRKAEGGTPACTVVIKDELGNEYRATLPMREPQTYG